MRDKLKSVRQVIGSILFNVFFVLWTITICLLGSSFVIAQHPKDAVVRVGCIWASVTLYALRILCGVSVEFSGLMNLPKEKPFIIASKHQSVFETILFLRYFKDPIYVLKHELVKIPLYGWYLKAMGMICIDRDKGSAALRQMLNSVQAVFQAKKNLIIFPEGTRVAPNKIAPLHSGIVAIHHSFSSIPIVPVAIDSGLYWPKHSWIKAPGLVRVHFCKPIAEKCNKAELLEQISAQINMPLFSPAADSREPVA